MACKNEADSNSDGLQIVATTGMIADMVENIVGDLAEVESLMGPGVDPHLYKASHGDLVKLRAADLIFYNGHHLEGKMGEVLEKIDALPNKEVIAVAETIAEEKLVVSEIEGPIYDPHIWFDVALWTEIISPILSQLKLSLPEHIEQLDKNATAYKAKLIELDTWVESEIASIPKEQRMLITAHDAFTYFGEAYDIEVTALQGISTVSEAGLKDVTSLVNLIADSGVKAVFVETSVSEKAIQSVVEGVKAKGGNVEIGGSLYSDAMGEANSPQGNYIGMVRSNVDTIVNSLK